jgi:DNA-binding NtrC family response regulator
MNFRREATSGEEGVALFKELRALHPDVPVILLTAWTHLETAVDLVKAGAADYIAKPWDDARLLTTVRNLLELRAAVEENVATRAGRAEARARLAERYDLKGLIYESEALHTVASMAAQVAHADVPVLITGPNGAGKEVLADIVHANSARKTQPYVKVNAGALPDQLIEAELFGTEAGAFTGAKARAGRFVAADGGALFLDEIGNLPLAGQA